MAMGSLATSFVGAIQASVAVLLTVAYGFTASRFGLLKESSSKDVSKLCVKLFLPDLLITNVGSQLQLSNAVNYVPILIWSVTYVMFSLLLSWTATKLLGLPSWTIPAVAFNNTTSLPLLLVQSLDTTGILKSLTVGGESSSEAVDRARSYFLVCAAVCNSLTFALGPRLLDGGESPDKQSESENVEVEASGGAIEGTEDVEQGRTGHDPREDQEEVDEETSLLPDPTIRRAERIDETATKKFDRYWSKTPKPVQEVLGVVYAFMNAPVAGAVIGFTIGLIPALHRAFFNDMEEGGIFKGWLTSSIKNLGDVFAALQLFIVGSKLSTSFVRMKEGEETGTVPWTVMIVVFGIRFVFWPLVSVGTIYALASRTNLLGNDPMLWFCLMLMPTGPPAIKLAALADVRNSPDKEKLAIAKFLTIAYAISPLICFAVVGSLKASQAAMDQ